MEDSSSKALLNFTKPSISNDFLLGLTGIVLQKLKGNTLFPGMDEEIDLLEEQFTLYRKAAGIAYKGSSAQKTAARELKKLVQAALKDVCNKVNLIAKQNRSMLQTTGFAVSKETRSKIDLGPIEGLSVSPGLGEGTLNVWFKSQKGIRGSGFEWMYAKDEAAEQWTTEKGCGCSMLLKGFTPGTAIIIRAWITGARNQLVYSQRVIAVACYARMR